MTIRRKTYGMSLPEKLRVCSGPMEMSGCIPWMADISRYGYGRLRVLVNGKSTRMLAHRAAYELEFGPIPEGLFVRHRCDNRKCVNPSHLFLGTNEENTQDRHQKGRNAIGEANGNAKLAEEDVRQIMASELSCTEAASVYGVNKTTISSIRRGKSWRHIWAQYQPNTETEAHYQRAIVPLARMVHGDE